VLFVALTTGCMVMLAVSAWQLRRGGDRGVFTRSAKMTLLISLWGLWAIWRKTLAVFSARGAS
jgi:cytochrome bd-type quinol oxidase subunit 1